MALNEILVVGMFVTFMFFLFTGIPIAYVLGGVALLYSIIGWATDTYFTTATGLDFNTLGMLASRIYKVMDNGTLVALPMFIFMGLMLDRSGVADRLMRNMQDLLGRVRGGLALTVALMGIILAASTGIVAASVMLLGLLSLPLMMSQQYDKRFALGTVAASGTLGILIPPSIMLVIMGDQIGISVGDLFMGATIPGLLLGIFYSIYILLYGFFRPQNVPLSPDRNPLSFKMVWETLKSLLPTSILILAVLGSIFAGITTPTEASGVGALGATLLAFWNRQLSWSVIRDVARSTYTTLGYVAALFVGAQCFSLVLRMLGGDELIESMFTCLPLGPYGVLAAVLGIVFLLGFFLDWIEISLIMLPLLRPIIAAQGFEIGSFGNVDNPEIVWFIVLVAVTMQTSFLTPPVGFALFFLRGVAPEDTKMKDIYMGIIPYVLLQLLCLFILIIWPQIVLWLPSVAYQ